MSPRFLPRLRLLSAALKKMRTAFVCVALVAVNLAGFTASPAAAAVAAPGGISNPFLWLRGDVGIAMNASNQVSQWTNGGVAAMATQPSRVASNKVTWVDGAANFNAVVQFPGNTSAEEEYLSGEYASPQSGTMTALAVFRQFTNTTFLATPYGQGPAGAAGISTNAGGVGGNIAVDGYGISCSPTAGTAVRELELGRVRYPTASTAVGASAALNGLASPPCAGGDVIDPDGSFQIGGRTYASQPGRVLNGQIAEVVVYDSALDAASLLRVESYLAAKYGITLDQSTATSYVASDGVVKMWDATVASASSYNNDITVIGRDDGSTLYQKQSLADMSGLVTMALGTTVQPTNAQNTNTLSDKNFLSFGDDSGAISWTGDGSPAPNRVRLSRTWQAQEVGSTGTVTIRVPDASSTASVKLPAEKYDVYLVTDADGDFTSGATLTAMTLNGTNWETQTDLGNGEYFTFATVGAAPDLQTASDTGMSNTDNITSDTTPTFDLACTSGNTVTLYASGVLAGTATCIGGIATITRASAFAVGTYSITYTETDTLGFVWPASPPLSVTIDTAAPATSTPDLATTSDTGTSNVDNITNDNTPTFTVTCAAGETVTLYVGGVAAGTAACDGATLTATVTLPTTPDGTYALTSVRTDAAGNNSAVSSALSVTIDTAIAATASAPDLQTASDSGSSNTDNTTNDTTPTFDTPCVVGQSVRLYIDGVASGAAVTCPAGGVASFTRSPALAAGVYAVTYTQTDTAGNVSTSSTLDVTVDTAAPTTPVAAPDLTAASDTGSSSTDNTTSDTTPTFTVACTPGDTVTIYDGITAVGSTVCALDGTATVTTSALAAGAHSITYKATDPAGNTSASSPALAITIDVTAPASSIPDLSVASDTGSSSTDNTTSDNTPTFAVTCAAGETVELFVDGISAGTAACVGTTATITTAVIADGVHNISSIRTDAAGNASPVSSALAVTIDSTIAATTTAPDLQAASDTGASNTDNITNDTTPTFDLACVTGQTVTLYMDGVLTGTATACPASGVIAITAGATAAGTHSVTYTQTDVAGNVSTSTALNVTIDVTAPAAPLVAPDLVAASDTGTSSTDNITNDTTPTFDLACTTGDTVTLFVDGVAAGTALCVGGVASITTAVLSAAAHNITYKVTDPAGNLSAVSPTLSITVDTTAPATPSTAPDLIAASDTGPSSTDNITGDTTPTFTVTCAAGVSSVNITIDGVVAGSATCSGTTATVTVANPLPTGTYTVRYTQLDAAGNASAASTASLSVTVDATAPATPSLAPDLQAASDSGSSNTDNITNDNTPSFTLTCTTGDTVTLYIDGTSAGSTTCAAGTATITTTSIADGAYTVTYTETDPYANTSASSPELVLVVDTTAPSAIVAPDLQAGSDSGVSSTDNITNDSSPTFDVACSNGDTITFSVDGVNAGTSTCSGGVATFTRGATFADGTYTITYRVTDAAGNVSTVSPSLTVTIDSSAPATPLTAPDLQTASDTGASSTDNITSDTSPTVDVACGGANTATLYVAGVAVATASCVSGTANITAALTSGTYAVTYALTDAAGNTSNQSPSLSVTVDANPPTTPSTAPDLQAGSDTGASNTDNATTDNTPTFDVACTGTFNVTLYIDGIASGTAACSGGVAAIAASTTADGTHSVTYTQGDQYGNESSPSPALSILIDTTAPSAAIAPDLQTASDTGASSTDNITKDTTPTVAVACSDGDTVNLYVDAALVGTGTCGAGVVTFDLSLVNGTYAVTYEATDALGNVSAVSPALTLVIDTVGPATPTAAPDLTTASDTGASSTDNVTSDTTPTFVIACTTGETVTLYIDDVANGSAVCVDGTVTLTPSAPLGNGAYTITTFTASDTAGNESSPSPELVITVDTIAPSAPSAAPDLAAASDTGVSNTDNLTNDATPTFTVACLTGDVVTLYVDGVAAGTAPCIGGTASITTAVLNDGTHAVSFTETDGAGNASTASPTLTITVDTATLSAPSAAPDLRPTSDSGVSNTDNVTNDTTPTFDVACTSDATVTLYIDGVATGTATCVDGVAAITPTAALANGDHQMTFTETDSAGNESGASPALTITVDVVAPAAPVNAPDLAASSDTGTSSTDNHTNDVTPTFDMTCTTDSVVTLYFNDAVVGQGTCVGGAVSITTTAAQTDGTYNVTFTETDAAGNESAASAALAVTIDATEPAANVAPDLVDASDSGTSNTDNITNAELPTFHVMCSNDDSIVLYVDSVIAGNADCVDGVATITVTAALAEGTHDVTWVATDQAGNESAMSPNLSLTVDLSAPSAPTGVPDLVALFDSGSSSTDNLTAISLPTFTVSCETGLTVTLYADDAVIGTAPCVGGTASIDAATNLADGSHLIVYTQSDAAGNESPASSALSIVVDTQSPNAAAAPDLLAASDTGASSTDNLTNDSAPSFSIACVGGESVTLYVEGNTAGSATCIAGAATITVAALVDDTYTVTYIATDAAGNVSLESPALTFTIDTMAPAVPVTAPDLLSSSDTGSSSTDNTTSDNTPTFDMACTSGSTVTIYIDGVAAGTASCVAGTASITVAALSDGSYTVTFTEADSAGNESAPSPSLSIVVDATTPAMPGAAPDLVALSDTGASSTDNTTSDNTPTFDVVCTSGTTVTLYIDGLAAGTAGCVAGTASITSLDLTNATHDVTYTETDTAGNESVASPTLTITVDTVAPTAPTVAPDLAAASDTGASSTDNTTADNTPTFTVACTTGTTVTLYVDGVAADTASCVDGTASITTGTIAEGTHSITFTETDTAGNESAPSPTLSIVVDTTDPATPTTAPDLVAASDTGASSTDNTTADNTPTITVACTTGTTVTLSIDGVAAGTASCVAGTASITTGTIAEGTHSITFTETDTAGNASPTSPALTITIDAAAPTTPTTAPDLASASDTGTSNTDNTTTDNTPTITVACTTGTTVTLYVDGVAADTEACVDGTASITTSALTDGTHAITFTETDTAGNESAPSPTLSIVVDTTDPATPTTAPDLVAASDTGASSTDNTTADNTPTITVACTTGTTVTSYVDGVAADTASCVAGTASITTSTLAEGSHAITFTETDTAGNESDASPALTITIDTTDPATPSTAPDLASASDTGTSSTDNTTTDNTPTITVACTTGTTITLNIDGVAADTASCVAGTASITTSTLTDGTHAITFTKTDTAGNESDASPALTITIDTTDPATPTTAPDLVAASDTGASSTDNTTADNTPTITVACTTGTTVTLYVDGVAAGTAACVDGTASITTSTLTDGSHDVTYTETDTAGNASPTSPALTITIDATNPAAPAAAPDLVSASDTGTSNTDNTTADNTPTFTVACTTGTTVTLYVDGAAVGTASCVAGTASITTSTLTDGTHAITFTETDTAGNESDASPALTITVDATNPAAPAAAPDLVSASDTGTSNTDNNTADNTPTITVACTTGTTITLNIDGVAAGTASCVAGIASITTSTLAEGSHAITFTETDTAGNESDVSPALTITIDTTDPATPSTAPDLASASDTGTSNTDNTTADNTPTITVACTTGTTITLNIDGVAAGTADCVAGTASITTSTLTDGTHAITFTETDTAGNESDVSPALTITIDTTDPTTPSVTNGPITGTTVEGTGEAHATITIVDSTGATVCETSVNANGIWTCELPSTPTPGSTLTVESTDEAGNQATSSAAVAPANPGPDNGTDDGDGVPATIEALAGGGTGDGNGDGIADAQQPQVASVLSSVDRRAVTLAVSGTDCAFTSAEAVANATTTTAFIYPVGLFNYRLVCQTPGTTATVTIFLADRFDTTGWVAHKYNGSNFNDYAVSFGDAIVGGRTVTTMTFTVTDGGRGDDDQLVNTTIIDPIGPAVRAPGQAPALPTAAAELAFTGRGITRPLAFALLSIATGALLLGARRRRELEADEVQ